MWLNKIQASALSPKFSYIIRIFGEKMFSLSKNCSCSDVYSIKYKITNVIISCAMLFYPKNLIVSMYCKKCPEPMLVTSTLIINIRGLYCIASQNEHIMLCLQFIYD